VGEYEMMDGAGAIAYWLPEAGLPSQDSERWHFFHSCHFTVHMIIWNCFSEDCKIGETQSFTLKQVAYSFWKPWAGSCRTKEEEEEGMESYDSSSY
jgi:hypothetical protein